MVRVALSGEQPRKRVRPEIVKKYVRRVLREEGIRNAAVTVIMTGSRNIRAISREFLNHNHVTDVLTFDMEEPGILEGEVYINMDRAAQQARQYGVTFQNEFARLVIHGVLHLVGYEDETARSRRKMKEAEDRHVARWFRANH